jgi:hypothetical protein
MLRVSHLGPLTKAERELLDNFIHEFDYTVHEDRRSAPGRWGAWGGGITWSYLGLLVFAIFGAGAATLLKSFLESVGSEAGKKVVTHFTDKIKAEISSEKLTSGVSTPVVIIYEIREDLIAIIVLSDDNEAIEQVNTIPLLLSNAQSMGNFQTTYWVEFDKHKRVWKANLTGPSRALYKGEEFLK